MNKEEYKKYAEEHEDWAPGWDAIDECFEKLYPGQERNISAPTSFPER